MPTPTQPFVEPKFMTASGSLPRILAIFPKMWNSAGLQNNNGAKSPTSGQIYPTGK